MKYQDAYEKPRADQTLAERIALAILHGTPQNYSGLYGRGGFDHFWDNVDEGIHDEMWNEMLANIQTVIEAD